MSKGGNMAGVFDPYIWNKEEYPSLGILSNLSPGSSIHGMRYSGVRETHILDVLPR